MELSLNTNSPSLSLIERQEQKREEAAEKLASGKRINSAKDDAAGLQISERLTSQINNDQQQSYNAQDQINVNQVRGGQLSAINEGLQRANTLSVQAGNPLADQSAIQAEFDQLTEQINTIAGEALGDNSFLSGLNAADPEASQAALEAAFSQINTTASELGADSNALGSQVNTYQATVVNVSASRSRIQDTDFAQTTNEQQQANILLQSAVINKKDEESRKGLLINQLV